MLEQDRLKLLENLKRLRDAYQNEPPKEIVHSCDKDNKYKCRAAWWGVLYLRVSSLQEINLLSEETIKEYKALQETYKKGLVANKGLVTLTEITAANNLLENIIKKIESNDKVY